MNDSRTKVSVAKSQLRHEAKADEERLAADYVADWFADQPDVVGDLCAGHPVDRDDEWKSFLVYAKNRHRRERETKSLVGSVLLWLAWPLFKVALQWAFERMLRELINGD